MRTKENVAVMLEIFRAIERRDRQGVLHLCCPDVEFHWPPSLPYGGVSPGLADDRPTWSETWIPLQPTEAERRMDPRVVAASDDEVVVLWHQRGVTPAGDRLGTPVLGLYHVRDGKLARAQMFYFDTATVNDFLVRAENLT
jgi:ketosteroid isomerase-like protein